MAGKCVSPSYLQQATKRICRQHCRTFSSIPSRSAAMAGTASGMQIRGAVMKNMAKQKSMQSQMQKLKRGEMPDDLGRMPETLIKPESKHLPSLFSRFWKRRIRIEWKAFQQKFSDFIALGYQTKWAVKRDPLTRKWRYLPMLLRDRYTVARDLHARLYSAIAEGDRDAIDKIACMGLRRQLQIKLDRRQASQLPNESWGIKYKGYTPGKRTPWLIHALVPPFLKSTRIVADRTSGVPMGKDCSLRQVVVEIRSSQTLDKQDGEPAKKTSKREYVVIQKMIFEGEEEEWKIWGTTKPSTPTEITDLLYSGTSSTNQTFGERVGQIMQSSAQRSAASMP